MNNQLMARPLFVNGRRCRAKADRRGFSTTLLSNEWHASLCSATACTYMDITTTIVHHVCTCILLVHNYDILPTRCPRAIPLPHLLSFLHLPLRDLNVKPVPMEQLD